jgi:hypothetical protein
VFYKLISIFGTLKGQLKIKTAQIGYFLAEQGVILYGRVLLMFWRGVGHGSLWQLNLIGYLKATSTKWQHTHGKQSFDSSEPTDTTGRIWYLINKTN